MGPKGTSLMFQFIGVDDPEEYLPFTVTYILVCVTSTELQGQWPAYKIGRDYSDIKKKPLQDFSITREIYKEVITWRQQT